MNRITFPLITQLMQQCNIHRKKRRVNSDKEKGAVKSSAMSENPTFWTREAMLPNDHSNLISKNNRVAAAPNYTVLRVYSRFTDSIPSTTNNNVALSAIVGVSVSVSLSVSVTMSVPGSVLMSMSGSLSVAHVYCPCRCLCNCSGPRRSQFNSRQHF
jgi:hypothetical protein